MTDRRTIAINVGQRSLLGRGRGALSSQKVDADVIGRWAVHPTWDASGEDYTVTHIPSGLALADRMTKKQAIELARNVSLSLDVDQIDRAAHRDIGEREVRKVGGRMEDPIARMVPRG